MSESEILHKFLYRARNAGAADTRRLPKHQAKHKRHAQKTPAV